MEPEVTHEVNTTDDFWTQIESVLSQQCETHDNIDDALRSYLSLLNDHHEQYITTEDHLGHCAYLLYTSNLFTQHASYVRQQLVHCLIQEDETNILRIAVTFLLADARENEKTFDLLNKEGAFPRLVELVAHPREKEEALHRTLMELMYEMSRIREITTNDLTCVDDQFVCNLFDIIEEVSDDVNDPYHYPVIRVLLVLNEQFMVAAHDPTIVAKQAMPLTNKVVKVLSSQGSRYKTFGANIILLLNREDETSLQLLTLKLMYLLFTTPATHEYFYTNDLRVLVDILVRNLLDLPEYAAALRHTYLRVLHPLLANTQLQYPPYYKRNEIQKLLAMLGGSKIDVDGADPLAGTAWNHFEDVDDTTKRLVQRCQKVSWLYDPTLFEIARVESPTEDRSTDPGSPTSPISPTKPQPPQIPAPRKLRKRDSSKESTLTVGSFLAPQLEGARQSSISMAEMAQQRERPGIITPSRNPSTKQGLRQAIFAKKEKPPPPKARRSGSIRPSPQSSTTELEVTRSVVSASQPYVETAGEQSPAKQKPTVEKEEVEVDAVTSPPRLAVVSQESKTQSRRPPPAPKARKGWRMRKSKDLDTDGHVPGKFSTNLPSVNSSITKSPFSTPADVIPENSPFSPLKDKTLDPIEDNLIKNRDFEKKARNRRSVGAAMIQAQAEATRQVEETLEGTHISATHQQPTTPQQFHPPRSSSLLHKEQGLGITTPEQLSPTFQRVVLAPPSQAPIRDVPGPKVELEKSPFLSDEEEQQQQQQQHEKEASEHISGTATPDIPFEDANETLPQPTTKLSRRESWEDFDNDD